MPRRAEIDALSVDAVGASLADFARRARPLDLSFDAVGLQDRQARLSPT